MSAKVAFQSSCLLRASGSRLSPSPRPTSRNYRLHRSPRLPRLLCKYSGQEVLPLFSSSHDSLLGTITKKDTAIHCGLGPIPPPAAGSSWKLWLLGLLISAVLPYSRSKLWSLSQLKNKIEFVVETAEEIAEVVEKVAEEVEKVAEDVAEDLPDGGKLKEAVLFVDRVAKITAKDAHMTREIIDKVEELGKEAEEVVEMVIEKNNETEEELVKVEEEIVEKGNPNE